jgi:hypothetical protein
VKRRNVKSQLSLTVGCLIVIFLLGWDVLSFYDSQTSEYAEAGMVDGSRDRHGGFPLGSERLPIVDRSGAILAMDRFSPDGRTRTRTYPYGSLGAYVVGFGAPGGRGIEGVEFVYDNYIAGSGNKGSALYLTISREIQKQAEDDLAWKLDRLHADSGCSILMDINTGQILAMAGAPVWNPATVWHRGWKGLFNPALDDNVDPWILAPLMILANRQGERAGSEPKQGWKWVAPVEDVAIWSNLESDDFDMLPEEMSEYLMKLGFGQVTGIDLPGEKQGVLPALFPVEFAKMSETGFKATPIQILNAFAFVLNGGKRLVPHVALLDNDFGDEVKKETGAEYDKGAVAYDGSDRQDTLFLLPGNPSSLALASIKMSEDCKGGFNAQVTGIGYWPVRNPVVCYVTVLNNVKRDPRVFKGTLSSTVKVARNAVDVLRHGKMMYQVRMMAGVTPGYDRAVRNDTENVMPDVRGLSMRMAAERLFMLGISVSASGRGVVVSQQPPAGTELKDVVSCILRCDEAQSM